jgi:hypothetical protein
LDLYIAPTKREEELQPTGQGHSRLPHMSSPVMATKLRRGRDRKRKKMKSRSRGILIGSRAKKKKCKNSFNDQEETVL